MIRIEPLECRIAPAVFVVSTAADSSAGSLRQAILDANALGGADPITFGFAPGTVTTISLGSGGELLGNSGEGINFNLGTSDSSIGGVFPGDGNRFGPNGAGGIVIKDGSFNTIRNVTFVENVGLPIDLGGDGATANDFEARDADIGANGLQDSPALLTAYINEANQTDVETLISGPVGRSYRIESYRAATNGAPEAVLGAISVTTDAEGLARGVGHFTGIPSDAAIVALATDLSTGETSEVSNSAQALPVLEVINPVQGNASWTIAEGNTGTKTATFKVRLSSAAASTVVVNYSLGGTAVHGMDLNLPSGKLTFAPGETLKMITFEILGDTLVEADKTFSLTLDSPEGAYLSEGESPVGTLKDDDTSLVIAKNMRSATWVDVDGDLVTLKVNRLEALFPTHFVFVNEGDKGGQRLVSLKFPEGSRYAPSVPLNLSITATSATGGDGFVNVGALTQGDTDGVYGRIVIDGDLGSLRAKSVGRLTAASLGVAAASAGRDFTGEVVITNKLSAARITGDVVQTRIEASTVGSVKIGGDFDHSYLFAEKRISSFSARNIIGGENGLALRAGASIGAVKISGNITGLSPEEPVIIQAGSDSHASRYALANLLVKGDMVNTRILAGSAEFAGESLGPITVKGSWVASIAAAGIDPGEDDLYGTEDDCLGGTGSLDPNTRSISRIARITVSGAISGTPADDDSFGFFARKVGPVRAGDSKLLPGLVAGTDDVWLAEITERQA